MEVIHISESIPANDSATQSYRRTVGDSEIIVHNVKPTFRSKEAQDKEKEKISNILYQIFSKYV